MTRRTLLALGYGYSAAALAARLGPDWKVSGTSRSLQKKSTMTAAGVEQIHWDDRGAVERAVRSATHLLVSTPPDENGDPVLNRYRDTIIAAQPSWAGYLSTTGVYGDRKGGWVDETGELKPVNERSQRRVVAEKAWISTGLPVQLFRLAGIYGPGRSTFDRLRSGRARRVIRHGQFFSRIHVDDVARILEASIVNPKPGRVYNVADDEPAPPQDVVEFAADLIGLPVPPDIPFESADLSPMARSFYGESKRVSNNRIKTELGVELRYPDYRAGLRAVLAAGG